MHLIHHIFYLWVIYHLTYWSYWKIIYQRNGFYFNFISVENTTFIRCGYLDRNVLLNIWITLIDDLSMYPLLPEEIYLRSKHGTCKILNHNVYGYIITTQISLRYFSIIAPPGCCCIIEFTYGNNRFICTKFHSCSYATILGNRFL